VPVVPVVVVVLVVVRAGRQGHHRGHHHGRPVPGAPGAPGAPVAPVDAAGGAHAGTMRKSPAGRSAAPIRDHSRPSHTIAASMVVSGVSSSSTAPVIRQNDPLAHDTRKDPPHVRPDRLTARRTRAVPSQCQMPMGAEIPGYWGTTQNVGVAHDTELPLPPPSRRRQVTPSQASALSNAEARHADGPPHDTAFGALRPCDAGSVTRQARPSHVARKVAPSAR
jgi:hypothetical protein